MCQPLLTNYGRPYSMGGVGSGWTGGEPKRKAVGGVGERTNCGWIVKGRKKFSCLGYNRC